MENPENVAVGSSVVAGAAGRHQHDHNQRDKRGSDSNSDEVITAEEWKVVVARKPQMLTTVPRQIMAMDPQAFYGRMAAVLAINPPTPLESIEASLPHCDLVLVMSVMPGFGGGATLALAAIALSAPSCAKRPATAIVVAAAIVLVLTVVVHTHHLFLHLTTLIRRHAFVHFLAHVNPHGFTHLHGLHA